MIADNNDDQPELLGSDFSATAHRAGLVMAILRGTQDAGADGYIRDGCLSRRLAALEELWQDMSQGMSLGLRSRVTSSMADYFDGLKMQAAFRKKHCVPDVNSYIMIRRQASFTIPAFILLEYVMDIEFDKVVLADKNIMELRNSAVDYISLCNDIYSFSKEISLGDYFNLPSILYAHDSPIGTLTKRGTSSFQDAIDNAYEITLNVNAHCNSLIDSIKVEYSKPTTRLARAYNVNAYVEAVALGMVGVATWFHETPRYKQPCTRAQLPHLN